jgi:hypothetical protein
MKSLVFVLCFLPCILSAQFAHIANNNSAPKPELGLNNTTTTTYHFSLKRSLKRAILPGALSLAAGVNQGLRETLIWKRESFFNRFPNANRQYFDNSVSWENKYHRPHVPVQLTDAYHLLFLTQNVLITGAALSATIPLVKSHQNSKWYHKLADIGIQSAVMTLGYLAGSKATYNYIFK